VTDQFVSPLNEVLHVRRVGVAAIMLSPRKLTSQETFIHRRHFRGLIRALDIEPFRAEHCKNPARVYRSFRIHENQEIQFRASAFDWMNHALPNYSSLTPLTLAYTVDYATKNITRNYNTNTFGVMESKTGTPYQRIIELNVKYFF
jgi:hypothetical protein